MEINYLLSLYIENGLQKCKPFSLKKFKNRVDNLGKIIYNILVS